MVWGCQELHWSPTQPVRSMKPKLWGLGSGVRKPPSPSVSHPDGDIGNRQQLVFPYLRLLPDLTTPHRGTCRLALVPGGWGAAGSGPWGATCTFSSAPRSVGKGPPPHITLGTGQEGEAPAFGSSYQGGLFGEDDLGFPYPKPCMWFALPLRSSGVPTFLESPPQREGFGDWSITQSGN